MKSAIDIGMDGWRSVASARWLRASLALQFVLAVYFEAVLWFPLGRWNDQPGVRLIQAARDGQAMAAMGLSIAVALPLLLFALAFARQWSWLMWIGLVGYGTWSAMEIQSWWIPWIFGADARALHNQKFLERTFKLFPVSPTHPAPDAMHFVLNVILFAVVVATAIGLVRRRGSRQGETGRLPVRGRR